MEEVQLFQCKKKVLLWHRNVIMPTRYSKRNREHTEKEEWFFAMRNQDFLLS